MQLYFIRHAQSVNNLIYDQTGSWRGRVEDPELTDLGVKQAERLAAHLAERRDVQPSPGWDPFNLRGYAITHLYTSPMVRAAHTASLVGQAIGLSPVVWEDIHEAGGIYLDGEDGSKIGLPGKNRAYFEERFPALTLPVTIGENGWWNHRPFESDDERAERAGRAWRTLLDRHGGTDDHVAMVSHGEFFVRFLAAALGLNAADRVWFSMGNTAISRMSLRDDVAVIYTNRLTHLPPELVS